MGRLRSRDPEQPVGFHAERDGQTQDEARARPAAAGGVFEVDELRLRASAERGELLHREPHLDALGADAVAQALDDLARRPVPGVDARPSVVRADLFGEDGPAGHELGARVGVGGQAEQVVGGGV
jgi:hypothetical protein